MQNHLVPLHLRWLLLQGGSVNISPSLSPTRGEDRTNCSHHSIQFCVLFVGLCVSTNETKKKRIYIYI